MTAASYGANAAALRNALLSKVSTYRSLPNASYVQPSGEALWTPVDGREIPDSFAAGQRPQTLKSFRRSLNGEVSKRTVTSRFASVANLRRSAAVYPSPRIRTSTFSADGPFFSIVIKSPGDSGTAASTNMSVGSTATDQTSFQ